MMTGEIIRIARIEKGMTQEKLSFCANISIKTVQRIESGSKGSLESLERIADVLEMDLDFLIEEHKHIREINREFTNQAEGIDNSKVFQDKNIMEVILDMLNPNEDETILDLACGTGIVTKGIAPFTGKVVSLDVTNEMVKKTQDMCFEEGLWNVDIVKGNGEYLNFPDKYFDKVVTRLSIHHFKFPEKVLSEIKRVLKDNGHIVVCDIYSSDSVEEQELHNAVEQLRDPTHVKMLSLSEFQKLFELQGLNIVKMININMDRLFDEWMEITKAPERYKSIYVILKNLINGEKDGGIDLKIEKDVISFVHRMVLYKLEKI